MTPHNLQIIALVFGLALSLNAKAIRLPDMEIMPQKVVSFSNDLYAEVTAEKELIEKFLKEGKVLFELTKELEQSTYTESLDSYTKELPDGSTQSIILLHQCNGVFTDENGIVYFWWLQTPRILSIESEKHQSAYLVLDEPKPELINWPDNKIEQDASRNPDKPGS